MFSLFKSIIDNCSNYSNQSWTIFSLLKYIMDIGQCGQITDTDLIIKNNHGKCSHNSNKSWTMFSLFKLVMDNVLIIQINHGQISYYSNQSWTMFS